MSYTHNLRCRLAPSAGSLKAFGYVLFPSTSLGNRIRFDPIICTPAPFVKGVCEIFLQPKAAGARAS